MQRVVFPSIPNVKDGSKYLLTVVQIYQKIKSENPSDKEFKRWMRTEGWYDKETYLPLLELIDVRIKNKKVSIGSFAQKILAESNPEERQDLLFTHIAGQNEILVKYVFDAIQERLYSTNELFRMLTSYVYPGEHIVLSDFRGWLEWMKASERIRVLGIRWALGAQFPKSEGYVKTIDVDEILEEEAEDELLDEEEEEELPPPPEPDPEPEDDFNPGWEPPEDDEITEDEPTGSFGSSEDYGYSSGPSYDSDSPNLAPRSTGGASMDMGALVQALSALKAQPEQPTLIEARLLNPSPHLSAIASGAPMERIKEAFDQSQAQEPQAWLDSLTLPQEGQAENVRTLLEWYKGHSDRPMIRADQHGIMPFGEGGWSDGTRSVFLFRLACLAVNLLRKDQPAGETSFAILDATGFYSKLFETPNSVERLLDELFEQGLAQNTDLFADLHIILMLARSLRGSEEWCAKLEDLTAEEVYAALWKRLAAYSLDMELLWIVREMSMFGLLRQPELRASRVVPTPAARKAAFHLGFLETSRATNLPALLHASRRLTPLVENALEGPLVALWNAYGAHPPRAFWSR